MYDGEIQIVMESTDAAWWVNAKAALPEERNNYLVSVDVLTTDKKDILHQFVAISHYNGSGEWADHNKKGERIAAWMMLPEPFNKKEGD